MADIDVLLEVRGIRASTEGLTKFQAAMLRSRESIAQAGTAVSGIEGALDQLNRTGSISSTTLFSIASAAPAMVNPLTAAAVALGLLISRFTRLEQRKVDELLERLGQSTRRGLGDVENEIAKMEKLRGLTGKERELAEQAIEKEQQLAELRKETSTALKDQENRVKELGGAWVVVRRVLEGALDGQKNYSGELGKALSLLDRVSPAVHAYNDLQRERAEVEKGVAETSDMIIRNFDRGAKGAVKQAGALDEARQAIAEYNAEFKRLMELFLGGGGGGAEGGSGTGSGGGELGPFGLLAVDIPKFSEAQIEATRIALEQNAIMAASFDHLGDSLQFALEDTGVAAFDAILDAMDESQGSAIKFSKAFGQIFQAMIADVLRSLGREATVNAIKELALGFGKLGSPATAPLAAAHFKSAALWGAVAVAAGAGSAAISAGSGGGSTPSAPGAGAGSGGGGASGGHSGVTQQIILIGQLDSKAAEELHGQLQSAAETRDLSDF